MSGYFHNLIKDSSKYINSNNSINNNLLFDDDNETSSI